MIQDYWRENLAGRQITMRASQAEDPWTPRAPQNLSASAIPAAWILLALPPFKTLSSLAAAPKTRSPASGTSDTWIGTCAWSSPTVPSGQTRLQYRAEASQETDRGDEGQVPLRQALQPTRGEGTRPFPAALAPPGHRKSPWKGATHPPPPPRATSGFQLCPRRYPASDPQVPSGAGPGQIHG